MQLNKAIVAGLIGALGMTVIAFLARAAGMPIDMEMALGSLLTLDSNPATWLLGLVIHLVIGAVFGVGYAALFEKVLHRSGAGPGAALGLVHGLLSGLLLGLIPALHPLMPGLMPAPGLFMVNAGGGAPLLFFGLHAMFGAIVGRWYAPVRLRNRRLAHTV
ncbi:MAG TPA: hypothetical protein VF989_06085 [Polyangiaceae bacterium]|jgi:hypothetical protein